MKSAVYEFYNSERRDVIALFAPKRTRPRKGGLMDPYEQICWGVLMEHDLLHFVSAQAMTFRLGEPANMLARMANHRRARSAIAGTNFQ